MLRRRDIRSPQSCCLDASLPFGGFRRRRRTLGVSCCRKPQRSEGWRQSAARLAFGAGWVTDPAPPSGYHPLCCAFPAIGEIGGHVYPEPLVGGQRPRFGNMLGLKLLALGWGEL